MSASNELYPFSTSDGKHIPLDIILPLGARIINFTTVGTTFSVPSSFSLLSVKCTVDAVLDFTGAGNYGDTTWASACILHANAVQTIKLPSDAVVASMAIRPLVSGSGVLLIQNIQKWAGLALNRQLSRG